MEGMREVSISEQPIHHEHRVYFGGLSLSLFLLLSVSPYTVLRDLLSLVLNILLIF